MKAAVAISCTEGKPYWQFEVPKNVRIKIYKTAIVPAVLYGCETWSLTLREKHRLRVLENGVLMGLFGAERERGQGSGENCIIWSFTKSNPREMLFG